MAFPQVVAVAPDSPAARVGVGVGDELAAMNGRVPRDVIEYQILADEAYVSLEVHRGGLVLELEVEKSAGEPLGIEVSSAVFDRVRTCDNHCEFCFIYQLPKQLRKSLYVKDDDYRLSFLYGNFTTLTRFTELDLERVVTERLSPLYVSIHATDPEVRARMLRNRRGAMSLRWLRALLDNGIEVHGQIVVCPGVNDGAVLEDTLLGILERFPDLASAAVVPLGVSQYTKEAAMRPHSRDEAVAVLELVAAAQARFQAALGRRLIFAADEYYLLADRPFPALEDYEALAQLENGIGIARAFEASFHGAAMPALAHAGFFASLEGAPAVGYRAPRLELGASAASTPVSIGSRRRAGDAVTVLTGTYAKRVLDPIVAGTGRRDVQVVGVENRFFGGNIGVAGLLCGVDVKAALEGLGGRGRVLLPDVCLSEGRFLDGMHLGELGGRIEVLETSGAALARALEVSASPAPVLAGAGSR